MFGLFEPAHRRAKDDQEIRYFYSKYGEDAPVVLGDRASDDRLSSRDRRHWQRLARKARRHKSKWIDGLKAD